MQIMGFAGNRNQVVTSSRPTDYVDREGRYAARTELEGAQSFRSLPADGGGGRGQIPRWRFPGGAAGRLRALRGHRRADPAGRAQILERGSAGALYLSRSGAAAASLGTSRTLIKS